MMFNLYLNRNLPFVFRILLFTLLLLLATLAACAPTHFDAIKNSASQVEGTSDKRPDERQEQNSHERPNDPLSPSMSNTVLAKVWRRFIADGRYRLATGNDFRIPEWAFQKQLTPQRQVIEVPFILTPVGYAAIVIDTSRDDAQRFGLIILTTDENNPQETESRNLISWVYHDRDLSRTVLSIGSGVFYLTEFGEDGTYTTCNVIWEEAEGKYICRPIYHGQAK
jgi:hypothetical protein